MNPATGSQVKTNRHGIGLLEVIICTALVTVMVIPIAGVIRASGQSIAQADGADSIEADLRQGLRWLAMTIRDSDVVSVRSGRLQIRLRTGNVAQISVRRGTLWLDDGTNQTAIAENVHDVRFSEQTQVGPPGNRVGVTIVLRARDPITQAIVAVDAAVAIPPQA